MYVDDYLNHRICENMFPPLHSVIIVMFYGNAETQTISAQLFQYCATKPEHKHTHQAAGHEIPYGWQTPVSP